jgi:hypothetical protein
MLHLFVAVAWKENLTDMGCFKTIIPEIEAQKGRNRELENQIKVWMKNYEEAMKLLLLGMTNCQLCLCIMINKNKLTFFC